MTETEKPKLVQLDKTTLLQIELVTLKKQLNQSRRQNLELTLLDLQKEAKRLKLEETQLLDEILQTLGVEKGKSLKLVDPKKGLCAIE